MLRFRFFLLFLLLSASVALFTSSMYRKTGPEAGLMCQDYRSAFELCRGYIDDGKYRDAIPILQKLVREDPNNHNLNFLLGYCYFHMGSERAKALPFFEKAAKRAVRDYNDQSPKERNAPVFAYYYLGRCYHFAGRLEEALLNLELFRSYLVDEQGHLVNQRNLEVFQELTLHLKQVKAAMEMLARPSRFIFLEIPLINTGSYSVFGGQLASGGNAVYFSRERVSERIRGKPDIYILKDAGGGNWSKAEPPGQGVNSPVHDLFNAISGDERFLLFSSDRRGTYNIFYATREQNKWSEPVDNLSINSVYNETYAVMSGKGDRIVFVSDRPGGFGGKDIYKTDRNPDGSWTEPENLGFTVNTPLDEDTPWLSEDGNTLYFSSEGHGSMGGFDVFVTRYKSDLWSEPQNLGCPVNSIGNDLYFKWMPSENLAMLSSNRETGNDIYRILAGSFPDSGRVSVLFPPVRTGGGPAEKKQAPVPAVEPGGHGGGSGGQAPACGEAFRFRWVSQSADQD